MWIIASIPFWILGSAFLLGSFGSIRWDEPTTNHEAKSVFQGFVLAGICLYVAARIAS